MGLYYFESYPNKKNAWTIYNKKNIYCDISGLTREAAKKDKFWSGPTTKREGSRGITKQI